MTGGRVPGDGTRRFRAGTAATANAAAHPSVPTRPPVPLTHDQRQRLRDLPHLTVIGTHGRGVVVRGIGGRLYLLSRRGRMSEHREQR